MSILDVFISCAKTWNIINTHTTYQIYLHKCDLAVVRNCKRWDDIFFWSFIFYLLKMVFLAHHIHIRLFLNIKLENKSERKNKVKNMSQEGWEVCFHLFSSLYHLLSLGLSHSLQVLKILVERKKGFVLWKDYLSGLSELLFFFLSVVVVLIDLN